MHEIVTLQFGEQSNYLGTHFWNTQVSALPSPFFTYLTAFFGPILPIPDPSNA
jgi:hypothetical protein